MTARVTYFGAPEQPLFGWFHSSIQGAHADVGVVLCSAWGREDAASHHSVREWALRLSDAGWPCLRFDYLGEGDSAGDPLVHGGPQAWIASIEQAITELKRLSGVSRVVLLGVRVGALMACLAAQGRSDVTGLIAVAPVLKGRAYVRELTILQASLARAGQAPDPDGVFQSGGYALTEASKAILSGMDVQQLSLAPATRVLILDREDMPNCAAWAEVLRDQGMDVSHEVVPGYLEMMAEPHLVVPPKVMIDSSLAWLTAGRADSQKDDADNAASRMAPVCAPGCVMPVDGRACVMEVPMDVSAVPVFGILSTPVEREPSGHAVLILNTGADRRIGLSRMSVDVAREWARAGHTVLRIDLAGIGDAETREGRQPMASYPHEAMEDVRGALNCLRSLKGIRKVHVLGLCSGGYHALTAARTGLNVDSLILINQLVFFNAEGMFQRDSGLLAWQVHASLPGLKASVWSLERWVRLLSHPAQIGNLIRVLSRSMALKMLNRWHAVLRALGWPLKDDLCTTLQDLSRKGVQVDFVFAGGEAGEAILREELGSTLGHLMKRSALTLRTFAGADHVFSGIVERRAMLAYVVELLNKRATSMDRNVSQ